MKKMVVVLMVLVLLAGLVLAVSAGTGGGGGGGGGGWNNVVKVDCAHYSASNSTGRNIERIVPGSKLIRGGSVVSPPPLPIG